MTNLALTCEADAVKLKDAQDKTQQPQPIGATPHSVSDGMRPDRLSFVSTFLLRSTVLQHPGFGGFQEGAVMVEILPGTLQRPSCQSQMPPRAKWSRQLLRGVAR